MSEPPATRATDDEVVASAFGGLRELPGPPLGWQARVRTQLGSAGQRAARPARRPLWSLAVGGAVLAAAAIALVWMRGPALNEGALALQIAVIARPNSQRSARPQGPHQAQIGDQLSFVASPAVQGRSMVRIYRDEELVRACADDCRADGALRGRLLLDRLGRYRIVLVVGTGTLPPLASGRYSRDLELLARLGLQIQESAPIEVY